MIKNIYARNFKGFKNLNLDLKKINIVIGKNGAGKSTIGRLTAFIIDSACLDDDIGLNFTPYGIDLAGQYTDIAHKGLEATSITLGLTILLNSQEIAFKSTLTYLTELKCVVIQKFELFENGKNVFEIEIDHIENEFIFYNDNEKIIFNGLLPRISSLKNKNEIKPILTNLTTYLKKIKKTSSYIGPFREVIKRSFQNKINSYHSIGPRGENAPYILLNDSNTSKSSIQKYIEEWMSKTFNGKYIYIEQGPNTFSLKVKSNFHSVNLVDDGVGYSQLFPLIVERVKNKFSNTDSIEVVEQPELHLHPSACGVVSDLYLDTRTSNNIVILETHSKELVLRFRRRIAENKNINDDISLIYVSSDNGESKTDTIYIDENGEVDWWPDGIFEESFEEVLAINEANKK